MQAAWTYDVWFLEDGLEFGSSSAGSFGSISACHDAILRVTPITGGERDAMSTAQMIEADGHVMLAIRAYFTFNL